MSHPIPPSQTQLSAGLSTEFARRAAAEQRGVGAGGAAADQDAAIAQRYYVNQILAMDEGAAPAFIYICLSVDVDV